MSQGSNGMDADNEQQNAKVEIEESRGILVVAANKSKRSMIVLELVQHKGSFVIVSSQYFVENM